LLQKKLKMHHKPFMGIGSRNPVTSRQAGVSGMPHHFKMSIHSNCDNGRAGFTLIEVLIAMSLLLLGIASLVGLQVTCIRGNGSARIQTEATAIGTQMIEYLRLLPDDHPDLAAGGGPHELGRDESGNYTVRWVVTDDATMTRTKTVSVTVTPHNRISGNSVTIKTILAR
jgi:type IV pilus assembly protein PilV